MIRHRPASSPRSSSKFEPQTDLLSFGRLRVFAGPECSRPNLLIKSSFGTYRSPFLKIARVNHTVLPRHNDDNFGRLDCDVVRIRSSFQEFGSQLKLFAFHKFSKSSLGSVWVVRIARIPPCGLCKICSPNVFDAGSICALHFQAF